MVRVLLEGGRVGVGTGVRPGGDWYWEGTPLHRYPGFPEISDKNLVRGPWTLGVDKSSLLGFGRRFRTHPEKGFR